MKLLEWNSKYKNKTCHEDFCEMRKSRRERDVVESRDVVTVKVTGLVELPTLCALYILNLKKFLKYLLRRLSPYSFTFHFVLYLSPSSLNL